MNLVVNSKDAMPTGGKITIQSGNAQLKHDDLRREYSYIKPGEYVVLSVSDTGHGMDKETQLRIFEPFFTTKEKGKGTGLGLSTVYGIIKQSGGYVLVESELQRGTTFRIYLPRVEDALEPVNATGASSSQNGGSETVLLVEDEESVRQLVRETLESKGYKVLEADHGEAALHIVSEPFRQDRHAHHRRSDAGHERPTIIRATLLLVSAHQSALPFRLHRRRHRT